MRTAPADDGNEPPSPNHGLRLRPEPVCEGASFPVLHEYFEVVYGPLIGPTSVLLARTLARHVASAGGPVTVCPIELSREVGLRSGSTEPLGKKSHLAKSLDRLAHHRLVNRIDADTLGIVTAVPPVTPKILARLPNTVRRQHEALVDDLQTLVLSGSRASKTRSTAVPSQPAEPEEPSAGASRRHTHGG